MATSKKPKPDTTKKVAKAEKKETTKKAEVVKADKKTEVATPVVKKSEKTKGQNIDFGDKLTWIFNSWRGIWDAFILNIGTLLLVWIIPALAFVAAIVISGSLLFGAGVSDSGLAISFGAWFVSAVLVLLAVAVAIVFAPANTIIQLESSRGNKISFQETWEKSVHYILRYVGVYLLIGLVIAIPLILSAILMFVFIGFLLLPLAILFAIAVGFFTMLVPYVLVDKNLGVEQSIRQGYALAKQNWQWLLAVILIAIAVSFVTNFISVVIPFIGGIFSFAVSLAMMFVTAFVYVKQIAKN